nr:type II secretion system F family protein [Streptomyces sp. SID3343]
MIGVVAGVRGRVPVERPGRARRTRPPVSHAVRRARRVRRGVAAVVGVAAWFFTGWVLALPLVVLAVLGWPWLMAPTRSDLTGIDRLDALADWTRRLADLVELGAGLETAIITSRATCPAAIEPEVADLVARLQARWQPDDALRAFADVFADATSDKIAAALILRAKDRGPGLATALKDFSSTVREEVRQRRGIEADRASSRAAVRWITYIILTMAALMGLNRDYSSAYGTFLGQVALAVLAAGFIGVLMWMRSITSYRATPRFLVPDARSAVTMATPRPAPTEGTST